MNEKLQIKNIIFDLSEVLLTGIKETGAKIRQKHNISNDFSRHTDGRRLSLLLE